MSESRSPLVSLVAYARAFRGRIVVASVCSVLNKIFDLAPPVLIGLAVDIVTRRENSAMASLGFVDPKSQLWALAGFTVIIWVLESIFEYAQRLLWRNLAQSLQHAMRIDAYGHVQNLDMAYFEDQSVGGLMAVLNDDINQLERFLDEGANEIIQVITTVIAICGYFLYLDAAVGFWAMLPMPFVLWGSIKYQRYLQPRYTDVRERVGLLNGQLANNLGGIATIKSFTAEDHETERMSRLSDDYRVSNRGAIRLSSAFSPLIRIIILAGFTAMLVVGGFRVFEGALSVGSYSVIVFGIQRLLWPLTRLGSVFDLYQRAMASTRRVLGLLAVEPSVRDGERPAPRDKAKGEVVFSDVTFAYRDGHPVLRDIDLVFPAGKTTAIVGATGAGKSTVVKLLLRFYDPTGGRILLDGVDLKDFRVADLRGLVGLVSQDVFLFHGTVRENIAYGRRDASFEAIRDAAAVAEASEFIEALPEGYDTLVGERGQKLSGGQRQRLSIARAVLKDPPILVLDEATSSVDNETEAAIQRSMDRISVGRTTIVIAHRLSTVRNAHGIYVLAGGEVSETGHHETLLADGGLYAGLWRVQTGTRS